MLRAIERERSERHANSGEDCGYTCRVHAVAHEVAPHPQCRHNDYKGEDLAQERYQPDRAIVLSAIMTVLLSHAHNAFSQSREYLLKMCEFLWSREWGDAQLVVLRYQSLRTALLKLALLPLELAIPLTLIRQARRRRRSAEVLVAAVARSQ